VQYKHTKGVDAYDPTLRTDVAGCLRVMGWAVNLAAAIVLIIVGASIIDARWGALILVCDCL
jgi:hypothetical protein